MAITEREFTEKVVGIIRRIIQANKELGFDEVRTERRVDEADGRTYPDGIIYKNFAQDKTACIFEVKKPNYDVSDIRLVYKTGREAWNKGAPFFATWNMRDLVLWKTMMEDVGVMERRKNWWRNIIHVADAKQVDRNENWIKIEKFLFEFLKELSDWVYRRKRFTGLPLDEFFIKKLAATVDINAPVFTYALSQKCKKDRDYYTRLKKWIWAQGWHPDLKIKAIHTLHPVYEKIARIATYIFVNKILFYNIVKSNYPDRLLAILVGGIRKGKALNELLNRHFGEVLSIDYDTIYEMDIFDELNIPDYAVEQIARFLEDFDNYDFSAINYEILGHVYEDLIPETERHEMGQYFTPPSTVDLINSFCIQDKNDVVLDLGCGAGTFLVRAYARLKHLKKTKRKKHKQLLEQLWGTDKASFPAHLATINLVLPDLTERENFPYVKTTDAFSVIPKRTYFEVPKHSGIKYEFKHISKKDAVQVKIPEMNCVVGNPPYIRQEKIDEKDKKHIQQIVFKDWGKLKISQQADIYVYFFIHGAKFLKDSGKLGFVTSNSWLDVRYGAGLQKFFLDNFKIIAILESRVERSFSKADINTAITIVERCSNKKEREKNLVKFVSLKKKMDELIPQDSDRVRFEACDKLIRKINRVKSLYEDKQMRVYPKSQKELYEEGLEDNVYVGSKWGGKYLRAPDIFFKILEKGKKLFMPLKEMAEIKRGPTTGANEFFYLTQEGINAHRLEEKFLSPVVKSSRECPSVKINKNNLKFKILLVHKDKQSLKGTNVLKYIEWGEEKNLDERPTCKSRKRQEQDEEVRTYDWYDLGEWDVPDMLWSDAYNVRYASYLIEKEKIYGDKRFFFINFVGKKYKKILEAYLNCSLIPLFIELFGIVNLGQGVVYTNVYQLKELPIIDPKVIDKSQRDKIIKAFDKVCSRSILSIFEEVKQKDRQELDNIFFDILGLTKKERKEVYNAVCDLVRNRLEKAKTFGRNVKSKKDNFNSGTYAEHILSEVYASKEKRKFPDDFIDPSWETQTIDLPKIEDNSKLKIEEFFGKASLRIEGVAVDCGTTPKARFVELAIQRGIKDRVEVPADDGNAIQAVNDYLKYREMMEAEINETIKMFNLNTRQSKEVWKELKDMF
jgi:hypothetical protein